jgi:sec-independent protein translocase protein TatC
MARVDPDARMTLGEHLDELRRRIILALLGVAVGVAIAFIFNRQVFQVLFWPLWMGTRGQPPKLYYHTLASTFVVYFRVCLIFGLIISSPYVIYQLWQFVARGLYENERRVVRRIVLPSVLLFLAGVAFYFLIVSPAVVYFLLDFGNTAYPSPGQWHLPWVDWIVPASPLPPPASQPMASGSFVAPMLTLGEYINFTVLMGLVFGLAFQTPLVIVFLARTGIVPFQTLKKSRKYVFFICLLVAVFATPSQDLFSNVSMTLAMYLLYELGMLFLALGGRKRQPAGRIRD